MCLGIPGFLTRGLTHPVLASYFVRRLATESRLNNDFLSKRAARKRRAAKQRGGSTGRFIVKGESKEKMPDR